MTIPESANDAGVPAGGSVVLAILRWFLALSLINLLYNVCPIWLQQYLRLRVARFASPIHVL